MLKIESNEKESDVLIIEDDPPTIGLLKDFFEIKGYKSTGVNSGQKGLEEIKSNIPKLILLDIILPDINGYEVCRRIREDDKYQDVKIIYITAKSEEEINEMIEETRADGFLLKPFDILKVELLMKYLK